MTPVLVPLWAAAGLLVVAGALKLRHPAPLVAALRAVRLPAGPGGGRPLARTLAAAEVAVGVAALASGARLPLLFVAASYLAFTAYVVLALRGAGRTAAGTASCGCFGSVETPPSLAHAIVTAGYATAAGVAALTPPGSLEGLVADAPGGAVAAALLAGVTAAASVLLLTAAPRVATVPA